MKHPRIVVLTALLLAAVVVAGHAQTQTQAPPKKDPDVPYVPTPEKVVDEMLKMASPKSSDILYDLGSGDGRIVITAAKRYGLRGVGIDIDPVRIDEARQNAKAAGVEDRVKFLQQDLFDSDFREASIVTLYLLSAVNLKLRPKLLSDLKPGTRVVSHNYDMGDWEPKERKRMMVNGTEHLVFFWVIPPR